MKPFYILMVISSLCLLIACSDDADTTGEADLLSTADTSVSDDTFTGATDIFPAGDTTSTEDTSFGDTDTSGTEDIFITEDQGFLVGSTGTNCGSPIQGLEPVDCTQYGDINAQCVFSNHCYCTEADGFHCDVPSESGDTQECAPGSSCVPIPEEIPDDMVGSVATSCGSPMQGLEPVDCTKYGDVNAFCVFSNHCYCTTEDGFECEEPGEIVEHECAPGSSCVPST